ncbi:MAG TPA: class I SAM-dependent methyltransferase [Firmicutes bacterium]|nr:class I SAM-dependent methyltransferase [Bacillota bacterium]
MRAVTDFADYELLDASAGERLERWGNIILIRPDPQIIWDTPRQNPLWKKAHARYHRSSSGGGHWEAYRKVPDVWQIGYKDLRFNLKPMGFKHTGLFPEQAVNWALMERILRGLGRSADPFRVLNLFAYTGGATLACLAAGAHVTHVDASKGMVAWGKENARISGLADRPMRWLVDDCMKFVERELRRGHTYDAIIMDPPSYGRGPGGEVWKLEEQLGRLLERTAQLLSDRAVFFLVNSYTGGLSPTIVRYMVELEVGKGRKGAVLADEIGLPVTDRGMVLPCGNTTLWLAHRALPFMDKSL